MPPNPVLPATELRSAAERLSPKLVEWRRHLHAHPELSFREFNTANFVVEQLREAGFTAVKTVAETGVLVTVEGAFDGPCIAIRGDMDALPIQEVAGRPYGSRVAGVMHACGHDVHTVCALGAAMLLRERRGELRGTYRIIFQPGEELLPGGATEVIAAGGLENPTVDRIVGLHVAPDLAVGTFGVREGAYMASADEIYLSLLGDGGHAALANEHVDLIATAAQLIAGLQQVVSRKAPPGTPSVLSFGRVNSVGGATNVLTAKLDLAGTFRTYQEDWRHEAHRWIRRICEHTAAAFGAALELDLRLGYPALSNDPTTTRVVREALQELVGNADDVLELDIRPTAEDFAWYLQRVPGCFFRLGVRNEAAGITAGVHTSEFDVDERCLALGAAGLATAAIRLTGAD